MAAQTSIQRTALPAFSAMLISLCCSGCLVEPSRRSLTLEEEQQLLRQTEQAYSLPRDQQGVGLRQVECDREILEEKDWHGRDYLLDAFSDNKTACERVVQPTPDVMKNIRGSIDEVIDKNLKDALDNSRR